MLMHGGSTTKIAFYTLGCKLNQAETESMAASFEKAGFQIVSSRDVADIYVANTCTVTHVADRKSRHWLRMSRRRNADALTVATGCYAQRVPQELASIADLVVGNDGKEHLLELIEGFSPTQGDSAAEAKRSFETRASCSGAGILAPCHSEGVQRLKNLRGQMPGQAEVVQHRVSDGNTRVRSLIKIQDGCCSHCAYCIVPKVRPGEYSLPVPEVIEEIRERVARGYREVVLTGTKIGCYGNDGVKLRELVECILRDTSIERLHLSSLQPQEICPEFVALWQNERLCRHFHLALQSGCDAVLGRMRRRYSREDYLEMVNLIVREIPGAAITTDIIVGFPGESEEEFEQNYRFCQQLGLANIHVFPFSPRPDTEAAGMSNQVDDRTKKERVSRMLELAQRCRHDFCERFLGQTVRVLWEKEMRVGGGVYSGLTDNYIRVFAQSAEPLTNKMAMVRLLRFHNQAVWGELVGESPD
ncbi:MAG: tRNA (N(6)-L-threonylcarbamoyladenosine(37)-C(2))-methylthiotransferase MtaB [Chloroflexota bacterium]|nr:tRNA (N(6)-L-threonylcarbamoyladenosine(37)-C(2))-methylthiotransferase MtaB [Chloroflexota bacterium]